MDASAYYSSFVLSEPPALAADLEVSGTLMSEPDMEGGPIRYRAVLAYNGLKKT